MDNAKTFTLAECEAIILVADAIASERVHPEAVDFSSRSLALASGAHPHLTGFLLDWLGVFPMRPGYRRSVEHLRAVIAEYLPAARLQHADHLERLQAQGLYVVDDPEVPTPDTTGTVRLGDWEFSA